MNTSIFNNLEIYRSKPFSGLTDENSLRQAALAAPAETTAMVSYLMGAKDGGSFLNLISGGLGHIEEIESNEFRHKVMIDGERAIRIVKASGTNETGTYDDTCTADHYYGFNGTPIIIYTEEDYFGPGAILELDDREYQVRATDEPYKDGALFAYTCQNASGVNVEGIPGKYLTSANKVSRQGSAYEEYSDQADILNYGQYVELRNHLTTSRLTYTITGDAYATVLVIAMKDPQTGKTTYLWENYQRWKALKEWHKREESQALYSKYNVRPDGTTTLDGKNRRPIYRGAGILEQISSANKRSRTSLSRELIENFLDDIRSNMPESPDVHFLCFTGNEGAREIDDLMRDDAGKHFYMTDSKFISGSGQELSLGGQFTSWNMRNGISFSVVRLPAFNDRERNRLINPKTGRPTESQRMVFIPARTPDGGPNIVKKVRKGRELVQWSTGGSLNLETGFGKSFGDMRSNSRDGAEAHMLGESGFLVKFPIACGDLYVMGE